MNMAVGGHRESDRDPTRWQQETLLQTQTLQN